MQTLTDPHQQFAQFFRDDALRPFAYLVSKKLAEGHICIDLNESHTELPDDSPLLPATIKNNPWVADDSNSKRPFILHGNRLYLQRYFAYETDILNRIRSFINSNSSTNNGNEKLLSKLFPQENGQKTAANSAIKNNLTIITGGPGTGKTTTVAKILAILFTINPQMKVALAAPTGKAAVRMAESLRSAGGAMPESTKEKLAGLQPLTIHRLLGNKKDSPYFRHDKENPLPYDLVIADESSMIDAALFAKLLNAVGPDTRLILLGDKNQLASVEAGSLFGDLCNNTGDETPAPKEQTIKPSLAEQLDLFSLPGLSATPDSVKSEHSLSHHIVELTESYRFSSEKGIGKFSKAVINNDSAIIQSYIGNLGDEQLQLDFNYDENIFHQFIKGYEEYISETDIKKAIQKFNKLRILCAIRSGDQGVLSINKKVEKYLSQQKLIRTAAEFYEHRPIIVTKNYYELELYNGDVGIIRKDENGNLRAWFEDSAKGVKSVPPGFLAESETTFAMTIHKSQGSEYEQVLVILPDNDMPLLTAELLYTGVTRAKSKVLIQAAEEVLKSTAAKRVKRASGITERLKEEGLL